jgi:sugar-specific transcriptional regulator TrmB
LNLYAGTIAKVTHFVYTFIMNLQTIFKRLGFGKHASRIYEVISGNKKPILIAHISKKSDVARFEIYRNLNPLLKAGFIKKELIGKRTYYIANNPDKIHRAFVEVSETSSSMITNRVQSFEKELPTHIKYFKGFSGIQSVFDDVINHTPKGGTFYRYTSEQNLDEVNKYLSKDYRLKRDKKKLERLVISNPLSGKQKRPRLERFIKYIASEKSQFDQNIIQLVYGSRVAFINLNDEQAYIIEDKQLADFQTVIFNQLYKKL